MAEALGTVLGITFGLLVSFLVVLIAARLWIWWEGK